MNEELSVVTSRKSRRRSLNLNHYLCIRPYNGPIVSLVEAVHNKFTARFAHTDESRYTIIVTVCNHFGERSCDTPS
jgi:hypothetical protein